MIFGPEDYRDPEMFKCVVLGNRARHSEMTDDEYLDDVVQVMIDKADEIGEPWSPEEIGKIREMFASALGLVDDSNSETVVTLPSSLIALIFGLK